ncbi:MAG: PQQ-binding-like beta-propeller repeat protein [Defluviitaleaceae bacterium]|nr:PQQ-binding-like beta-propeller repeat protein [Defluviitaleaceae bacterium]
MKKIRVALLCIMIVMALAACSREAQFLPVISETESIPAQAGTPAEYPVVPAVVYPVVTEAEPLITITHTIINQGDMPRVLQPPRDTSGRELVEYQYPTPEVQANIFFETTAPIRSSILAEGGTLYFGNEDNMFYALDISTGQVLWTFSTDEAVQTLPVLTDGKIIFNVGNSLYILNALTGEAIHTLVYPSNYNVRISQEDYAFNDSHVVVVDGIAYFAALNGDLVAVDIIRGEIVWSIEASLNGLVASGISYYNGMLYFIGFPGHLFGVDIQTRQISFETRIRNMAFNPMTIYDGKIYIGGRNFRFYCIDAQTGEVIWRSHSRTHATWFSGGSVIIGNNVFATTADERQIIAFDKDTGEFQRIYSVIEFGYTRPLRHGNNIVAVTTNTDAAFLAETEDTGLREAFAHRMTQISYAMAIDTVNHTKLWLAPIEDIVLSPPAIYQGVLYFGSDSGTIYSINLERP